MANSGLREMQLQVESLFEAILVYQGKVAEGTYTSCGHNRPSRCYTKRADPRVTKAVYDKGKERNRI